MFSPGSLTFWSQTNQSAINHSILTVSICFFHCQESACVLPAITVICLLEDTHFLGLIFETSKEI